MSRAKGTCSKSEGRLKHLRSVDDSEEVLLFCCLSVGGFYITTRQIWFGLSLHFVRWCFGKKNSSSSSFSGAKDHIKSSILPISFLQKDGSLRNILSTAPKLVLVCFLLYLKASGGETLVLDDLVFVRSKLRAERCTLLGLLLL